MRFLGLCAAVTCLLLCACNENHVPNERNTSSKSDPIINGQLDTEHQAVVAVIAGQSKCTGTIVAVSGNTGYVLTAAHCLLDPPVAVVLGNDFSNSNTSFAVTGSATHPCWDSLSGDYDYAMVKFSGASPNTPVIPLLAPPEDSLAVGTMVVAVGFGKISDDDLYNTKRWKAEMRIDETSDEYLINYQSQQNKGMCFGDCGGPQLTLVGGIEKVAAVTSFWDNPMCAVANAFSARVTRPGVAEFINGYVAGSAPTSCAGGVSEFCNSGYSYGDATCDACIDGACCGDWVTCENTPGCIECLTQTGTDCQTIPAYNSFIGCLANSCTNQCGNDANGICDSGLTTQIDQCDQCLGQSCCSQATNCVNNADCVDCLSNPDALGCSDNTALNSFYGCAAICYADCNAGSTGICDSGLTSQNAECDSCLGTHCCNEADSCVGDPTCLGCLTDPSAPGCQNNAALNALNSCFDSNCDQPCANTSTGGTDPGNGATAGAAGTATQTGGSSGFSGAGGSGASGGATDAGAAGNSAGTNGASGSALAGAAGTSGNAASSGAAAFGAAGNSHVDTSSQATNSDDGGCAVTQRSALFNNSSRPLTTATPLLALVVSAWLRRQRTRVAESSRKSRISR